MNFWELKSSISSKHRKYYWKHLQIVYIQYKKNEEKHDENLIVSPSILLLKANEICVQSFVIKT